MYIRRTKTKTADHGEDSYTYRIVESVREGAQVKQRTLLNLGKDFAIEPAHWPLLAARIEQLLQGSAPQQAELFALADDVGQLLEATAERYSDVIIAKLAQALAIATPEQDYHRLTLIISKQSYRSSSSPKHRRRNVGVACGQAIATGSEANGVGL
jgi:hypothetical protein